jgi:hypothetical protein
VVVVVALALVVELVVGDELASVLELADEPEVCCNGGAVYEYGVESQP